MPIYEYFCHQCKKHFELLQKIDSEPTKICPNCASTYFEKSIPKSFGMQFKGSGFYINDYATDTATSSHSIKDCSDPSSAPSSA